ncbi:MAG: DUF1810 family protein, partial [Proteobacteria bacterium]|nr:DUF1810 family protein [Pseudomonadota bacterium]
MMANDPFDLNRFVVAQDAPWAGSSGKTVYDTALAELHAGDKHEHWMWFVLPQLRSLGQSPTAKMYTRAEWIMHRASDISRAGVFDNGGITPVMKIAHLCESFRVQVEIHSPGAGNLHALCAMAWPGKYYERGLLHPFIDYERPP